MRILAISGSLRSGSSNTLLLRAAMKLTPQNVEFTIYEGLGNLPHFSPELDGDDAPEAVEHFRGLLQAADGVIISTPEYAYGMPGSLKNALDWTVASGEFVDKPVATISASPNSLGGERAHASLLLTLGAISARVVEGGKLTVPFVRTKLNSDGEVSDVATIEALEGVLGALLQSIEIG